MTANDAGLVARRCEVSAWHKEPQDYCNSKSMVLQVGSLNPLVFRKIFSQSCARVMSYQSAHDATVMLIFSNHIAVVWLQVQSPNQQNQRRKTGVSKSVSFCDTQANAVRFLTCKTPNLRTHMQQRVKTPTCATIAATNNHAPAIVIKARYSAFNACSTACCQNPTKKPMQYTIFTKYVTK